LTERKKTLAAEAFMERVREGDRSAQGDFLLTMYDVALASCHTTTEFGMFMGGIWIGFLNVQNLMKQGYPLQFADTPRSKEMSGNEVIIDEVTKSWYRSFKKWKEGEARTEKDFPEEFEEFKKILVDVIKSVDKENN